jgi:hypothetical protein
MVALQATGPSSRFALVDLDALSRRTEVIAAITALLDAHPPAGHGWHRIGQILS